MRPRNAALHKLTFMDMPCRNLPVSGCGGDRSSKSEQRSASMGIPLRSMENVPENLKSM